MNRRPRVVLDTNVVVSAMLSKSGASNRILGMTGGNEFRHVVSVPLALEYEATLRRRLPAARFPNRDIDALVDYLCLTADRRPVFFLWRPILADSKDDMILEVAVAAMCTHIVTFNDAHFAPARSFGLSVIKPSNFLSLIRGGK